MALPHEVFNQVIPVGRINAWIDAINSFGGASVSGDGTTWLGTVQDPVSAPTANYSASTSDATIECNGTFTVSLYAAVGKVGRRVTVKNAGSGVITVAPNGVDTIDGVNASTVLAFPNQAITLEVNAAGSGWSILNLYQPAVWIDVPFSSGNFTTNSTGSITPASAGHPYVYRYLVVGKTMFLQCSAKFVVNNGTTTDLRFAIPGGYTARAYDPLSNPDENQARTASIWNVSGTAALAAVFINITNNCVVIQRWDGTAAAGFPSGVSLFTGFCLEIPLA